MVRLREMMLVLVTLPGVRAQEEAAPPDPEREAVRRAVEDYVDAVYLRDPERLERSVLPELVKYGFAWKKDEGRYAGAPMSFEELRALASRERKTATPPAERPKEIEVLAVLPRIAAAKVRARWGYDYFQLQKSEGRWKVRHVVWQSDPSKRLPEGQTFEPSEEDREAVRRAGEDYLDAFYLAKPELLDRSVDPTLAKFGFYRPEGAEEVYPTAMSFAQLKALAAHLHAEEPPSEDAPHEVEVLDLLDRIAVLRIEGHWGVDLVHAVKDGETWKLRQILWQSPPAPQKAPGPEERDGR